MGQRGRWVVLRTAWLLVGAAIGLAAALLLVGLGQVVAPSSGPARTVVTLACLLPALLIGLLPGVRELEVTAARTMLGVTSELVVPTRLGAEHRWRTVLTVTFHLLVGLLAGVLLVGVIPAAVAVPAASVRGQAEQLLGRSVPSLPPAVAVLLGLGCVVAALVGTWGLGHCRPGRSPGCWARRRPTGWRWR